MTLLFSFIRILLRKISLILSRVNLFGYIDIFASFIVFVKSSKQFKLLLYEKEKQKGTKNDKIIIMHNCMVMHQSSSKLQLPPLGQSIDISELLIQELYL